ncbi:MAG TPA: outer membrane lipoprotein chaperone LolA [Burkholderiaceae bacterium]
MSLLPTMTRAAAAAALALAGAAAQATPTDDLRQFVRTVQSGRATFSQTVTSPDGKKKRSTGSFEFERPNRFRFVYDKPYAQTLVGDGAKVWLYDPDLDQVSARKMGDALGTTPAALLVSTNFDIDRAFTLADLPAKDGLEWVQATPRAETTIRTLRVGFRDHALAELEMVDSFGQDSLIVFDGFQPNAKLPAADFRFVPPKGADVIDQ